MLPKSFKTGKGISQITFVYFIVTYAVRETNIVKVTNWEVHR